MVGIPAEILSNDWKPRGPRLENTFSQAQGVGAATERLLWKLGLRTWGGLLAAPSFARYHCDIEESSRRHAKRDWNWFNRSLPAGDTWRAFGDFHERTAYVDIETDGGRGAQSVTVIGIYDGTTAQTFVAGRDLEAARERLEDFPVVVTFNGAQFDMPLIRKRFLYNLFNHIHVDLRFGLRRLGLRGGLKSIEQQLGIERAGPTQGLGGLDAVRLWNEYRQGSAEALDLLLAYNREDIQNLQPLMRFVYERLSASCGFEHEDRCS